MIKHDYIHTQKGEGFTIVELIMALAFLTFMLLFVVTALVNLMATYNKGLVYKGINQTGRVVVEEISRNIRLSPPAGTNTGAVAQGRLCTGGKAYIWNTSLTNNRYTGTLGDVIEGMVRVDDGSASYCTVPTKPVPRSTATIIVDSAVAIRSLTVTPTNGDKLFLISTQLTTRDNAGFEPGPGFICASGKEGEFCASVTINTAISVRNTGGGE